MCANMRQRLPVWADGDTQNALLTKFGYAFVQPEGSPYPPILNMHTIDGDIVIDGLGGKITLRPFEVNHGSIEALGFRIGDLAYLIMVDHLIQVNNDFSGLLINHGFCCITTKHTDSH